MHPSNNFFISPQFSQSQQTKIQKTLLIQSLSDNFSQQYQVSVPYDSLRRELDVGQVLHEIFFEILNPQYQYQVFYFSEESGYFCFADVYPFTQQFVLGEEFIPKDEIFVAFRKVVQVDGHNKQAQTSNATESTKKKRRINDRTILETLQKVSIWRQKCEQQKITYQEAAKQIDIPKKTLDDYYALIRTGEEHGFDFEKNYSQKIGVLRQFVKQKQKENKQARQKQSISVKQKQSKSVKQRKEPSKGGNYKQYEYEQENPKQSSRKMSIIDKMILQGDSEQEQQEE